MVASSVKGGRIVSALRPTPERAVRVLAAEAADPPGRLARLLEGAGHRVVARAANAEELTHLVGVAHPEVVVFDAEMSAVAVAALRESRPAVGVVVVWPEGAAAEVANEHVSPARVGLDLAGAVRRAAPVVAATGPAWSIIPAAIPSAERPVGRVGRVGRGGLELTIAAVLTFLLVVAAVSFRAHEGGGTIAAVDATFESPSAAATNMRVVAPDAPSGAVTTDPPTVVVGDARTSPSGSSGPSSSDAQITARSGGTDPTPDPPPHASPVLDLGITAREAGNGPMILVRAQACRAATVQLGIVGARPSLRRLLDRCAATDSAGLLQALARLVAQHGPRSGRAVPHPGGPGKARGRGSAADHRQNTARHHGASSGQSASSHGQSASSHGHGASSHGHGASSHGHGASSHGHGASSHGHGASSHGHGADHRPGGQSAAAHHGNASSHAQAGVHHTRH